jgi:hypothetical protein
MNKFTKDNLKKEGQYLVFGPDRKFVARFKYSRAPFTMSQFRKELIANHTPEYYFQAYNDGKGKAPLEILKEKNPAWYRDTLEAFKNRF